MNAIRSTKYLAGSRGAPCTLRIPGVCTGGGEDTVPAHIRDRHTGRSIKASDLSVADACFACHQVFDRQAKMPDGFLITGPEWLLYALRGLQETIERRVEMGLLVVSQNDRVQSITVTELKDGRLVHHEGKMAAKKPGRKLKSGKKLESRPKAWPTRPLRSHQQEI